MQQKARSVLERVDLGRPELEHVRSAPDRAGALVEHLAGQPRPAFRFEYHRRRELLEFLRANYARWRSFDTAAADRVASLSIEEAAGHGRRALRAGLPAVLPGDAHRLDVQLRGVQRLAGSHRAGCVVPVAGLPAVHERGTDSVPRPPAGHRGLRVGQVRLAVVAGGARPGGPQLVPARCPRGAVHRAAFPGVQAGALLPGRRLERRGGAPEPAAC